ncbi:alpha-ketoglutarate-dependent dioxygenase AlkB-like protein [Tribonema minus]|uniref:Alpha-ketoglutarate-dependent dioxygenase AlkB-like protein n=1 Tax=Tribonema minus TaxID=303371 RepID=A0A835YUH1_9STRA|nr:alpha-ketoglutarate-dependent dioxygenase AlkB-like protein [Tribonema minus]
MLKRRLDGADASASTAKRKPGGAISAPVDVKQPPKPTMLQRGMVLIKAFLNETQQEQLIGEVLSLGQTGFFQCDNEKTRHMRMMHLGRSTAPPHKLLPLSIPLSWQQLAEDAVTAAAAADTSLSNKHLRPANVCVVNHYTSCSKLGWHQDMMTKRDCSIPVVSLSLGDSATFHFKNSYSKKATERSVVLESGDALVFGGQSRGVVHSVTDIKPPQQPISWQRGSAALAGRFNVNLREL